MNSPSKITAALLLGMSLAAIPVMSGCGAQSGRTIMTQGAGANPVMGKAPESGSYALYTAFSPNPTMTTDLKEGDALGFRKTDDGKIEAVAGDKTHVLDKATAQAYWKLEK